MFSSPGQSWDQEFKPLRLPHYSIQYWDYPRPLIAIDLIFPIATKIWPMGVEAGGVPVAVQGEVLSEVLEAGTAIPGPFQLAQTPSNRKSAGKKGKHSLT